MAEVPAGTTAATVSLKERQRQERAALILQAAEAVLAEKGFHETSMEEIASRVGIAKGTLYLHYPSKENLVIALFAQELAAFREVVEQLAAMDSSASARLQAVLRHAYTEMSRQRQALFSSLYRDMSMRHGIFEKQLALRDHIAHVAETIKNVLEDGKAAGEFDPHIPTLIMLSAFLSLLSSHHYEQLPNWEQLPSEEIATYISRIYLRGIMPVAIPE